MAKIVKPLIVLILLILSACIASANTITVYPSQDTYVDSHLPNYAYGIWAEDDVGYDTSRPATFITFIKFDLSSIPVGSTVNSEQFYVYNDKSYGVNQNLSQEVDVGVVTSSWTELGTSWNNKPTYSTPVIGWKIAEPGNWYSDNGAFKSTVQGWINDPSSNYGFDLDSSYGTTSEPVVKGFYSRRSSVNQPYLVIDYTPSSAPPSLITTIQNMIPTPNPTPLPTFPVVVTPTPTPIIQIPTDIKIVPDDVSQATGIKQTPGFSSVYVIIGFFLITHLIKRR